MAETKPKKKVLVVDDDPDIRDVIRLTLEEEGYEISEAPNGAEGVEQVRQSPPDLILLDFTMPKMDGGQVCQALKKDLLLQHVPIIMLTSRGEVADKVQGINVGADDYMTKPFEPAELLARVQMIVRRTARSLDANPLTKLPGNATILEQIQAKIDAKEPAAICYIDLDKFKAFNDTYGFERGDTLIKATGQMLLIAMRELGNPDDFLGHIGGDDFVMITTPDKAEGICRKIVRDFAEAAPQYYSEKDRTRGYIEAEDRDKQVKRFDLMTISIAVVTNENRELTHVAEVAQIGAELKEWAKERGGNRWVRDRRGD
ncbi:MAG: diguanylate cyclase response regulator [Candidatus Omnitrophica bacterium CG11_big_fil_rev_8_21_14_0_20_64_10]|nr:MAG: diguanylate cyclase response regulator [Candidatus Omnitrophica bacterium CG11_big_fil_rev_8_21_14_0_20_64_10]